MAALRYRECIVEGAMDLIHGGGLWHDALYLPEAGVRVLVTWQPRLGSRAHPIVHALFAEPPAWYRQGTPRLDLDGKPIPASEAKVEHIQVPGALAARMIELAQQTRASERLAADLVAARAVGDEQSVRPREGLPPPSAR